MLEHERKKLRKVLVISGPTGCGESTMTNMLIEKHPVFKRLITATSRRPRLEEKDKVDYYFFSKDEFENEIEKGNIIEYTHIKNRDVYYGTYKPDLEQKIRNNFNVIVNVDIVGAKYYKDNYDAVTIFIMPDSLDNLRNRLITREPGMLKGELAKRLENAKKEIENEGPFYDYKIINKQGMQDAAFAEIEKILLAEGYLANK